MTPLAFARQLAEAATAALTTPAPTPITHPPVDPPTLTTPPTAHNLPAVNPGMGPAWSGSWTVRPPSNLTEQIWAAHDEQQAGLTSGVGSGEDDGKLAEKAVSPSAVGALRSALKGQPWAAPPPTSPTPRRHP